ncbi:H-NS histone family protein [Pacificitalea manganoxidans]|uniref:H-NS histone family protein n=1 Tax=Pacificitalea manganoxidans TaxID=1411902 RepID=UPI001E58A054|nr:H-NS histone family protein [Pacificitalea manganoxidans]MDR6307050.1 DNA-binding protein H-NS [Pacificitalea manganoxidans]
MALVDLDGFDRRELEQIKADCDKAIQKLDKEHRRKALAAAEAAAREHGFSLSDLSGSTDAPKSNKPKSPPKYRHPENPEMTWTGRGRKPNWLSEALRDGKSLESFAI